MATPKSPFIVVRDFASPKQCEQIVDDLNIFHADTDTEGNPVKMTRSHDDHEAWLFERWSQISEDAIEYYGAQYRGTERFQFEFFAEGTVSEPYCDNSQYVGKKWVRTKDRDFTGILFLTDYNETIPFDSDYEVYGGKLEFIQHGFGFNPERGTLIIFPSGPHFIYANAAIITGELYQAKFHVAAKSPYLYQPADFPGDYRTWFPE